MSGKCALARILSFVLVFFLLISGTGCGFKDVSSKLSQVISAATNDEVLFDRTEMPQLKADRIDYYYSADMDYSCFLVCVNGSYGTLDDEGFTIVDPMFEKPYFSINYYYDDSTPPQEEFKWVLWCDNEEDIIVFDKDGGMTIGHQIPTGYESESDIYWMAGKPIIVPNDSSEPVECSYDEYYSYENNIFKNTAYMNSPRNKKPGVVAIREVLYFSKNNGLSGEETAPVFKSKKYGLFNFDTNKMVTDFIFDECLGPIEGIFAVRQGKRWGYITDKGKMITDYLYDVAHVETNGYNSDYNSNEMYLPANGYIVTILNGKYGIIDTEGKTVVKNEYDYISQVSRKGTFYALKGNTWSHCVMK